MNDLEQELEAMKATSSALEPLEVEVRQRVMNWLAAKYDVPLLQVSKPVDAEEQNQAVKEDPTFGHFVDLFDKANPAEGTMKALVAGYWFQHILGQESFTGYQVNNELKNAGHPLSNVTSTLGGLEDSTPALVRQMKKNGKSKQGRKLYKITNEGLKRVAEMLA